MALIFSCLLIGGLFGAGLAVSGMMNPAKVIGFLDLAGDWDPTLAVVMVAALIVSSFGFGIARSRENPILSSSFQIPSRDDIDWRLIAGAALFGIGWGIAGFCPGPAIAALATGMWQVGVFFLAMVAGMWGFARTLART
jgi:uncharacterized protein